MDGGGQSKGIFVNKKKKVHHQNENTSADVDQGSPIEAQDLPLLEQYQPAEEGTGGLQPESIPSMSHPLTGNGHAERNSTSSLRTNEPYEWPSAPGFGTASLPVGTYPTWYGVDQGYGEGQYTAPPQPGAHSLQPEAPVHSGGHWSAYSFAQQPHRAQPTYEGYPAGYYGYYNGNFSNTSLGYPNAYPYADASTMRSVPGYGACPAYLDNTQRPLTTGHVAARVPYPLYQPSPAMYRGPCSKGSWQQPSRRPEGRGASPRVAAGHPRVATGAGGENSPMESRGSPSQGAPSDGPSSSTDAQAKQFVSFANLFTGYMTYQNSRTEDAGSHAADDAAASRELPAEAQQRQTLARILAMSLNKNFGESAAPQLDALAIAKFGDSNDKSPVDPRKYKTRKCNNYEKSGACPYEDTCCFAHGDVQLRSIVDNARLLAAIGYYSNPLLLGMSNGQKPALPPHALYQQPALLPAPQTAEELEECTRALPKGTAFPFQEPLPGAIEALRAEANGGATPDGEAADRRRHKRRGRRGRGRDRSLFEPLDGVER